MKRLLTIFLILIFVFGVVGTAEAKSKTPKILGSQQFIDLINKSIALLAEKDPETYSQIFLVKKIIESAEGGSVAAANGKKRIVYVNIGLLYNLADTDIEFYWLTSSLSHEFNHVANRKFKGNRVDLEKMALAQEIRTLIKIGAPQYMINYKQWLLNNLDDPSNWWWAPAFAY